MIEIVNVVASGSLNTEIDLESFLEEFKDKVEYDPEVYPGAYFRFDESSPLITIYRTGKYIVTGASSEKCLEDTRIRFLTVLADHGVLSTAEDENFAIQNYVCVGELDVELDLPALAIGLGLNFTEYEPEQFAGLVYRPPEFDCVLLIMRSGKVIVVGADEFEIANDAFNNLNETVAGLL